MSPQSDRDYDGEGSVSGHEHAVAVPADERTGEQPDKKYSDDPLCTGEYLIIADELGLT